MSERHIMLNAIVQIQISQVERILPVTLIQHPSSKVWNEEAERGCKVVSCPNRAIHLRE